MDRGFQNAFLAGRHRADFTGQTHLAEHHQIAGQGSISKAGHDSQQQGQIGTGFQHPHAPHHVGKHVLIAEHQTAVAVQHGQQQGQAILLQTDGDAPRVAQGTLVHQGLNLHQQRACPLPHHHDHAAGGGGFATLQKDGGGVAHLAQAALGHGENTQLIDRAKAILLTAQGAKALVVGAFQEHGAIDHVFEHLGPGQTAVFGHVPDQQQHGSAVLGRASQTGRAVAHLSDAAGRRGQRVAVHHLNRVDHQQARPMRAERGQNRLHVGLGHQLEFIHGQPQAPRAQGHLGGAFLAAHVEGGQSRGEMTGDL